MQMLPCLMAGTAGKDFWIVLLFGAVIDISLLFITIIINKLCPNTTIHDLLRNTFGKVVSTIIVVLFFIYFICTAVLPFEAVRDVFASNLFDTIPWQIFAIFLLLCVGYLSFSGLRTLGRTAELYFYVVAGAVVFLIFLGVLNTDFSQILPLSTINLSQTTTYFMHSIWFGDYMIFFVLIGRINPNDGTLKFKDIFFFAGAIVIYAVAYVTLWGLYTITTPTQASLLSSISAFSLLSLEIGRLDWFLVLLSQIASVISCSTYVYCAAECVYQLNSKRKFGGCVIATLIILYLADIILFKNLDKGILFFTKYLSLPSFILQVLIPLTCLISAIIIAARKKRLRRKLC